MEEQSFLPPPPPPKDNKKVWIIVGIIVAVLVCCCLAIAGTLVVLGTQDIGPLSDLIGSGTSIVGTWDLEYDWDCDGGASQGTLYIHNGGTFDTASNLHGTWSTRGTSFTMVYDNGTTYTGRISGTFMEGTMVAFDGATGCWKAYYRGP
ncbi:MAG: hypothetical protein JXB85_08575 [Anaerolineales bacterium]|nr:hypothetical protein [Anaerolineales bacterium]